jgi:hypothetical protein
MMTGDVLTAYIVGILLGCCLGVLGAFLLWNMRTKAREGCGMSQGTRGEG